MMIAVVRRTATRQPPIAALCSGQSARGTRYFACTSADSAELLSVTDLARLPPLSARELVVRVTGADNAVRQLDIIIVRAADGAVHAYENSCPHQGGPLNASPGLGVFAKGRHDRDKGLLACSRHGARFRPSDGVCVRGPCAGHALHDLPIQTSDSAGVTVSIAAARRAASLGGRLLTDASAGEVVAVSLHPMVDTADMADMADTVTTAHPEGESEGAPRRAQRESDPGGHPMPNSPAPLDAAGARCRWDARLGCWRASNGNVYFPAARAPRS